jgi:hypothetical protein
MNPANFETVCRKLNVWLHLEGHALAALALLDDESKSPPTGDSLSLTIGSWIGVPAVPFVTLYKVRFFWEIRSVKTIFIESFF